MLLEPESRATLVGGRDVQLSKEHTFLSLCFSSSTALYPCHSAWWCVDLKLAELCQWPPSEYVLVYWWMQGKSWDLYSYKSTSIQLFLVLIIVCFIKRAVFTSKALMLELMAESLHPEIAQLIRCKNYSSKDLPSVAAPNHIGLESKICESLNYFRYTSIRSFSNVLLEPASRTNWWEGRMVGSQKSISSPLIICFFASSLAKVSENFQVESLNSDGRRQCVHCSYMW